MIEYLANANQSGPRKPVGPWGPLPEQDAVAGLQLLQDAVIVPGPELGSDERLQALVRVLGLQQDVDVAVALPYDTSGVAGQPLLSTDNMELADELRPLLPLPGADTAKGQQATRDRDWVGVPLPGKAGLLAHLYVFGHAGGQPVSALSRQLATSLAAVTAAAIDSAGARAESRQDHRWLQASIEINRKLITGYDDEVEVWQLIAQHAVDVAEARTVTLCMPSRYHKDMMRVVVAAGEGAERLTGNEYPIAGSLTGQVMSAGRGQLGAPDDAWYQPSEADGMIAETMGIPLQSARGPRGAIMLNRSADRPPFTTAEVKLAEDFADRAVLALELSEANAIRHRLEAVEERERIAADLHDHVIQQLFATGLRLQSSTHLTEDTELRKRLTHSVDALDETIQQIRTTIFTLSFDADPETSLRAKLITLVTELEPVLGTRPHLQFLGPVDTVGTPELIEDAVAVVRESLTNVAKHAQATRVDLTVDARGGHLSVTVRDNGVGVGPSRRRSGRANLERRAVARGGSMQLESPAAEGTVLIWTVPTRN